MKRKAAIWLLITILLLMPSFTFSLAIPIQQAGNGEISRPDGTPDIKAASAILADCDRGQILYETLSNKPLHIATLCKLMTVLLALESGDLNSPITISKESLDVSGSALSLEAGEKYTLEDLCYGIMLTSANDAAVAVAEHISGDTESFIKKMNETSQKLNMKNTNFVNPTGLYDKAQYTTAYDIMLFINYAVKNPDFNRIFSTQARPWKHLDGSYSLLTSQNKLFWSYNGVDGGKTGFNDKQNQTLITTATRNDMKLVCIILDAPEKNLFTDAASVLDYGFTNYRKSILVKKNDILKSVDLEGNRIDLICTEDTYYIHPAGENFIKEFTVKEDIQPPILKTKISGNATYVLNDLTTINISLYPSKDIAAKEDLYSIVKKKIGENKNIFILVFFLLVIEVIMIIVNLGKLINKLIKRIVRGNKNI